MRFKKLVLIIIMCIALVSCNKNSDLPKMTNMADDKSIEYVKDAILGSIKLENSENFFKLVEDYNISAGKENLIDGFTDDLFKDYDVGKIIENREKFKSKYPDTNCRINTFLLLKDEIEIDSDIEIDDSILFIDNEKIEELGIFSENEVLNFKKLFSRISTVDSKNPKDHFKIMSKHLSKIKFTENADMVSVVLHDNLDGDYLFIGHVGVLVPASGEYLFIEKISFEEPYQAIIFKNKEDAYKYLKEKFKDYTVPETAPPFIMENDKYIEI